MTRTHGVYLLAGSMILLSVVLGVTISHWWLLLTAFVGLNLVQSSFTGFCPAESILKRFGFPEGCKNSSR